MRTNDIHVIRRYKYTGVCRRFFQSEPSLDLSFLLNFEKEQMRQMNLKLKPVAAVKAKIKLQKQMHIHQ